MDAKKLMLVVGLAAGVAATSCASNDWTLTPCEAAAAHLTECTGRPATAPADCDDRDAELVLETSCEQVGLGVKGFLDDLIDAFWGEDESGYEDEGYEDEGNEDEGYEDDAYGSWDDDPYWEGESGPGGRTPESEYEDYRDCLEEGPSERCCPILDGGNVAYVGDSDGGRCCGLSDYFCGWDGECCPGLVCADGACAAEPDDWSWDE